MTNTELEIIKKVFDTNEDLAVDTKEKIKNIYYNIKSHLPHELFESGLMKFSYNKGLTHIKCELGKYVIFLIPNENNSCIKLIYPNDKQCIYNMNIMSIRKDNINRYRKIISKDVCMILLEYSDILNFSSFDWQNFSTACMSILNTITKDSEKQMYQY